MMQGLIVFEPVLVATISSKNIQHSVEAAGHFLQGTQSSPSSLISPLPMSNLKDGLLILKLEFYFILELGCAVLCCCFADQNELDAGCSWLENKQPLSYVGCVHRCTCAGRSWYMLMFRW